MSCGATTYIAAVAITLTYQRNSTVIAAGRVLTGEGDGYFRFEGDVLLLLDEDAVGRLAAAGKLRAMRALPIAAE